MRALARRGQRRQTQAAAASPFAWSGAHPLVPAGEEERKGADECGWQLEKRKGGGVRSLTGPIFLVNVKARSSSETGDRGPGGGGLQEA